MSVLSLIVAMDSNRLIGADNGLPWHLPEDLAFFKRVTLGKPVLMGRKTQQSIGRPLPGRRNIVVSRDPDFRAPGCELATGLDEALQLAADVEEVMLIGGASLYQQAMPRVGQMYITRIHHQFSGDTWFPEFDEGDWRIEFREDFDAGHKHEYNFSFIKYVRKFPI
jgi:dihydrofolate reductase